MTLLNRLRRAVTGEAQAAPAGRADHASDEVMARQLQESFDREQAQTQQQARQASAADQALAQELQAQESRRPQRVQQPPPQAQRSPPPAQQPQPGALPSWIARPLAVLQQSVMGLPHPTRLLTCTVCQGNMFSMQRGPQIVWNEVPFWGNRYCPIHNSDGTPRCTSCSRFCPVGEEWVELQDGRSLCLLCLSLASATVDTADAQLLYDALLAFYSQLGMPLPVRPPMMLVDLKALNSAESRETHGQGRVDGPVFHTRGLCLSTEYTTIYSMSRVAGLWPFSAQPRATPVAATHCEVTAVLVLYGLPRLLTGSILAHELMHAWLRLSGVSHRQLPLEVEEGLAQLLAHIWLESQLTLLVDQSQERQLADFFLHQVRNDPTAVYGGGFRAAHAAYRAWGLQRLIAHVRQTGQFPLLAAQT